MVCKLRAGWLPVPDHVGILILDFHPPELWEKSLWFKALSLWHFIFRACCCLVTKLCLTLLRPYGHYNLPGSLCPWDSPGKNTWVEKDLPEPETEPTAPALTGRFFTTEPPGKRCESLSQPADTPLWEWGFWSWAERCFSLRDLCPGSLPWKPRSSCASDGHMQPFNDHR